MAAKREGPLKIHLVHGAKSHFLTLSLGPDDCSDVITVDHLQAAAEQATSIPRDRQKLIYKGKTLTGDGEKGKSLRSMGVKDAAKVMLLGSKSPVASAANPQNEETEEVQKQKEDISKLETVESSLTNESTNLRNIVKELDNLKQDKSSGEERQKELQRIKKSLLASAECFMRLLESLDTLRFDSDDSTSRSKRKTMVNQIHSLMDECEALTTSISKQLADKK